MKLCSALALASVVFAGCAGPASKMNSTQDPLLPQVDVVQVKENSNKALRIAQEAKLKTDNLNSKLAEIDHRLNHINEKASRVSIAKIEELEVQLSLIVEAIKDLQAQVTTLKQMPRSAPQKKTQQTPKAPPSFSPTSAYSILNPSDAYFLYNQGLTTFDKGDYKKSRHIFSEVISKYPESMYSHKSRYWIGECYYAQGEYAQAIASFKKVKDVSNFEKKDDAHFQIARALYQMGHTNEAKNKFKNFLTRFPNSPYVTQVENYLSRLK